MGDLRDRHELFDRHLRGELNESEQEQLAELLDSDPSARQDFVDFAQWDTRFAEALREPDRDHDGDHDSLSELAVATVAREVASEVAQQRATATRSRISAIATKALLVIITVSIVTVAIVALIGSFNSPRTSPDTQIAKITGMSGSLQWTGGGGRIVRDLDVGAELSGGTIEAMTPDSWFELEFNDGSTVAIIGTTMLTFSDRGQKELRLKAGNLYCSVTPQPAGRPMLVHTQSAVLEVLGTQFDVEVSPSSTRLNVAKGKVRLKRLSDGSTVDVPAKHGVFVSSDGEMSPVRVPDSVNHWKSHLDRGPEGTHGKWRPRADRHAARLKAIPMVPSDFPTDTLYMLAIRVSREDSSPVVLRPDSRFIVRGQIASSSRVYFGIKLAHSNGEFAGKFRADTQAVVSKGQRDFEAVFRLRDFKIDPCVRDRKDEFPGKPDGLVVTGVWCFTSKNSSGKTGLEVVEIELVPPHERSTE